MTRLISLFRRLWSGNAASSAPRKWNVDYSNTPWFDRPDALDQLERKKTSGSVDDAEYERLSHWCEKGYFTFPALIDSERIDMLLADLDNIWTTDVAIPGLAISGAKVSPDDPQEVPHRRIVDLAQEDRFKLRDSARWRVHSFFHHSPATRAIFDDAGMKRMAAKLLGAPAVNSGSINFMYGSQQALHQDMMVFAVVPINYLIGVWISCEDVDRSSGPLVFFSGSHKEPIFKPFAENYPQTMLKTCSQETSKAYRQHLHEVAAKYKRVEYLPKKGEVLFWHGMLIHGGSEVTDSTRTRKSFVFHYVGEGMDQMTKVKGPFNW